MSKETYILAAQTITVDRGDHCQKFVRGDDVSDAPASSLQQMIRLNQAVTEEEFAELDAPPEPEEVVDPEAGGDNDPPAGWLDTPLADIGLEPNMLKAFVEANLSTIREVVEYGNANDGSLTSIAGIGEASETKFKEILQELAPKE